MYKINNNCWDSEEEFINFNNYIKEKINIILDKQYNIKYESGNNWITIYKKLENNIIIKAVAKVFIEPSEFGIDNGKISKLSIYIEEDIFTRKIYYNYDRGLDLNKLENNDNVKKIYNDIIEVFN